MIVSVVRWPTGQLVTVGAHDVTVSEGRARFTVDSDAVNAVLPVLAQREVQGLRIEPPSLEELFLRHYGDDLTALDASTGSATGAGR